MNGVDCIGARGHVLLACRQHRNARSFGSEQQSGSVIESWAIRTFSETRVLYRMRPIIKSGGWFGKSWGARPIQLFEGSRPWGGICKLNGVGVKRKPSGKGSGIEERSAGVGALVVCVGIRA